MTENKKPEELVTYVCQQVPFLMLKVEVEGKVVKVQFDSGSVQVKPEVAKALDEYDFDKAASDIKIVINDYN